jgi:predicted AAA+ superfamily ATPase
VADKLLYAITETALFDENTFTLSATAGNAENLPKNVLLASENDCNAIAFAGSITSQEILADYKYNAEIAEIIPQLPKWETGKAVPQFDTPKVDLKAVAQFHKENGCGMFARYKAFIWRNGEICPVEHPDKINMDTFVGYDGPRKKVLDNTLAFLEGKSANNCLLYGDMGTGKSSTVKAIANKYRKNGLRVVEMPKERLMDFPILVDKIAPLPMKFIIFIDDLSFQSQDQSYTSLKAVLEGGLAARPDNTLIYATSNRRHIVKESWNDRNSDDINRRDNMQETLSLSDRFGLAVCFSNPDKNEYLDIVYALADKAGIKYDKKQLGIKAETFALGKGGRSPRCAKQFVESLLF